MSDIGLIFGPWDYIELAFLIGSPGLVIGAGLPPADDQDLDRLEALYQLTDDIKEPYSWTARAYMLRARKGEHKFGNAELSAIYQLAEMDLR